MIVVFATPEDVEASFYEAIARADLAALMSVWADDEEIVCIHPTGQRLTGAEAEAGPVAAGSGSTGQDVTAPNDCIELTDQIRVGRGTARRRYLRIEQGRYHGNTSLHSRMAPSTRDVLCGRLDVGFG